MGIGEEEEADLSRRGFLKMLGGAAVVAAAPTYVFAPSGGWNDGISEIFSGGMTMQQPIMFMESTARGLNDWIIPKLVDNVFKPSPIFMKMRGMGPTLWNLK
jgi:hypothetical protein